MSTEERLGLGTLHILDRKIRDRIYTLAVGPFDDDDRPKRGTFAWQGAHMYLEDF